MRFLEIFAAGVMAAYVMFLVNWVAFRAGWVQVSVVEAFNEFLARVFPHHALSRADLRVPRAVIRLFMGGVFALVYSMFVSWLPIHTTWSIVTLCLALGFVHGFGVGTADAVTVVEGPDVVAYKQFGYQLIATHVLSHMVFGLTLGLLFTLLA